MSEPSSPPPSGQPSESAGIPADRDPAAPIETMSEVGTEAAAVAPALAEQSNDGDEAAAQSPDWVRVGAADAPAPIPYGTGLDTNTRWTLLFLCAVFLVTLGTWGTGKLACNYQPPASQRFEPVALESRIDRPKDAALEFHHQLYIQDYDVAAEIATDQGKLLVEEARAACDAACQADRPRRAASARTRASLLRVQGQVAWGHAETFIGAQMVSEGYYELRREQRRWVVVRRGSPPPLSP